MLAVVSFIHVEKVTHHHEVITYTTTHQKTATINQSIINCSLCDYVFSKDADIVCKEFAIHFIKSPRLTIDFHPSISLPHFATTYLRGPPSC